MAKWVPSRPVDISCQTIYRHTNFIPYCNSMAVQFTHTLSPNGMCIVFGWSRAAIVLRRQCFTHLRLLTTNRLPNFDNIYKSVCLCLCGTDDGRRHWVVGADNCIRKFWLRGRQIISQSRNNHKIASSFPIIQASAQGKNDVACTHQRMNTRTHTFSSHASFPRLYTRIGFHRECKIQFDLLFSLFFQVGSLWFFNRFEQKQQQQNRSIRVEIRA